MITAFRNSALIFSKYIRGKQVKRILKKCLKKLDKNIKSLRKKVKKNAQII